jgi:hypothetical protein
MRKNIFYINHPIVFNTARALEEFHINLRIPPEVPYGGRSALRRNGMTN